MLPRPNRVFITNPGKQLLCYFSKTVLRTPRAYLKSRKFSLFLNTAGFCVKNPWNSQRILRLFALNPACVYEISVIFFVFRYTLAWSTVLLFSSWPVFNFSNRNNKSEPMTNRQKVRIILFWWTRRGSNPRPLGCEPNALPTVSLLCTPYALWEKENQRIFVHIKRTAMPTAFRWNKYSIQTADFQDEAIWGVIWLADKWATGPWDVTHLGFRCIASRFKRKHDVP